jgi:hypothetical protein
MQGQKIGVAVKRGKGVVETAGEVRAGEGVYQEIEEDGGVRVLRY